MTEAERLALLLNDKEQETEKKKKAPNVVFMEMMNGVDRVLHIKQQAQKETQEIMARTQFTQDFRTEQVKKMRDEYQIKIRDIGVRLMECVEDLREMVEKKRPTLNVADENFRTALTLIQASRDAMEAGVQRELVRMFTGKTAILKALKPVFEANKLYVAVQDTDAELKRLERAEQFPDEFANFVSEFTYALENYANVDTIYARANEFAKVYGLPEARIPAEAMKILMRVSAFGM